MNPQQKQAEIVDDLSVLPDAFERLNYLVDLAGKAEPLETAARRPEDLVEGCQAELWLSATSDTGALSFHSYSEAPAVAALGALFCNIFSGASPEDIATFEPTVLEELGLNRALTPNRQNGARQIIAKIKGLAAAALP